MEQKKNHRNIKEFLLYEYKHAYAPAYVFVHSSADKPNKASYLFSVYLYAYACAYIPWMGCEMNILKPLGEKDVGAIGIGAMIVFIAMVLVAGIAASVLIQTSGRLETQAMRSGSETVSEVATGIQVEGVEGYNISGWGNISRLAIEVRSRAGSRGIDLSETIIELSNSTQKNIFTYNSGNFTDTEDIDGDVFRWNFYPWDNDTVFGIIVLEDADHSITDTNPVINSGDHVMLTINITKSFGGFEERVDVYGQVIPEEGAPGVISFTTPGSYTDEIVELQ